MITPIHIPDPPHQFIRSMLNGRTILFGPPDGIIINPTYTDRVSLDNTTLTLELRNLIERDTGQYSLTVNNATVEFTGVTSLYVFGE